MAHPLYIHYCPPTYVLVFLVVSFLLAFPPISDTYSSSPPFALHALPKTLSYCCSTNFYFRTAIYRQSLVLSKTSACALVISRNSIKIYYAERDISIYFITSLLFLFWKKNKRGLWDHRAVCVSLSPSNFFVMFAVGVISKASRRFVLPRTSSVVLYPVRYHIKPSLWYNVVFYKDVADLM
jgi:hypothetical protein